MKRPLDLNDFSCSGCGSCCREFYLPYSPKQLLNLYHFSKDQRNPILMSNQTNMPNSGHLVTDIELIVPMVRLVREEKNKETGAVLYFYTCVHFNRTTRKCEIYSIRPEMCRAFPFYGHDYPCFDSKTYPKCRFVKLVKKREKALEEETRKRKLPRRKKTVYKKVSG